MILVIDKYDSFTFNLVHELRTQGATVQVHRNDSIDIASIALLAPSHMVISPGPGHPRDAGICCALIRELGTKIPTLGVCLGHQAIGHAFGARIGRCDSLKHGEATSVYHDSTALFRGVGSPFPAGRYHSLVVEEEGLPGEFEITAFTRYGIIMGLSPRDYPIHGVQFHPESILTPEGRTILRNFL